MQNTYTTYMYDAHIDTTHGDTHKKIDSASKIVLVSSWVLYQVS